MIKVIATDMDGTFLDENGRYDKARLRAVLERFQARGMTFVAASGRSLLALEQLFADFRDQMAFVAENGCAVVYDGEMIASSDMTKSQYLEIIDLLRQSPYLKGHDYLLSGQKGAYVHKDADNSYIDFIKQYYENVQIIDAFDEVDDVIFKLTANFSEDTVRQGEAWVNERLSYARAVTTGFRSVDIILTTVNKRTGLEALCQHLGLSSEQVLAFGDNLNDLEMLEFAGSAIATANARDDIKAICDQVIGSCSEQAVMTYLEDL